MDTLDKQLEAERQLVAAAARVTEVVNFSYKSAIPIIAPPGQEYVDPYLFEIGHFKDRAEYEELSRTARIVPRAKA